MPAFTLGDCISCGAPYYETPQHPFCDRCFRANVADARGVFGKRLSAFASSDERRGCSAVGAAAIGSPGTRCAHTLPVPNRPADLPQVNYLDRLQSDARPPASSKKSPVANRSSERGGSQFDSRRLNAGHSAGRFYRTAELVGDDYFLLPEAAGNSQRLTISWA
jgi:hypothetical protein